MPDTINVARLIAEKYGEMTGAVRRFADLVKAELLKVARMSIHDAVVGPMFQWPPPIASPVSSASPGLFEVLIAAVARQRPGAPEVAEKFASFACRWMRSAGRGWSPEE